MYGVVNDNSFAQISAKTGEVFDVDIGFDLQTVLSVEPVMEVDALRVKQFYAGISIHLLATETKV